MSRLYPCVYCTEDGYCMKYSDDEVTSWCVQGPCKDEKPSNADKIRAMSDEELDKFLGEVQWDVANYCGGVTQKQEYPFPKQRGAWLDWLKQEVET